MPAPPVVPLMVTAVAPPVLVIAPLTMPIFAAVVELLVNERADPARSIGLASVSGPAAVVWFSSNDEGLKVALPQTSGAPLSRVTLTPAASALLKPLTPPGI